MYAMCKEKCIKAINDVVISCHLFCDLGENPRNTLECPSGPGITSTTWRLSELYGKSVGLYRTFKDRQQWTLRDSHFR